MLSQTKLPENHTLHSGTYPCSLYMGLPLPGYSGGEFLGLDDELEERFNYKLETVLKKSYGSCQVNLVQEEKKYRNKLGH